LLLRLRARRPRAAHRKRQRDSNCPPHLHGG
jgi:hypothetical protein